VARANPVWQQCRDGADVMVIFRGNESYISPNWYPSKHETHRQVPTWNYEVVHVHGRLTVQDDERFVGGVVARLTREHESSEPKPWRMGDSAPEYIDAMLRAIVGIEVAITRSEPRGERQTLRSRGADSTGAGAARQSHARVWLTTLESSHIDSDFENFQLN